MSIPLTWRTQDTAPVQITTFDGLIDKKEHIALEVGDLNQYHPPLVRVHSECLTGDVFGSGRCDCGKQLTESLEVMKDDGGIILYLRQEGRGIGLYNKLDTYVLQDRGYDTFEANHQLNFGSDQRDYAAAAQMLHALGVDTIRLLSNNPTKRCHLEREGVTVAHVCPTGVHLTSMNRRYLSAKVEKANHTIKLD